jgi:hypothetical protein
MKNKTLWAICCHLCSYFTLRNNITKLPDYLVLARQ